MTSSENNADNSAIDFGAKVESYLRASFEFMHKYVRTLLAIVRNPKEVLDGLEWPGRPPNYIRPLTLYAISCLLGAGLLKYDSPQLAIHGISVFEILEQSINLDSVWGTILAVLPLSVSGIVVLLLLVKIWFGRWTSLQTQVLQVVCMVFSLQIHVYIARAIIAFMIGLTAVPFYDYDGNSKAYERAADFRAFERTADFSQYISEFLGLVGFVVSFSSFFVAVLAGAPIVVELSRRHNFNRFWQRGFIGACNGSFLILLSIGVATTLTTVAVNIFQSGRSSPPARRTGIVWHSGNLYGSLVNTSLGVESAKMSGRMIILNETDDLMLIDLEAIKIGEIKFPQFRHSRSWTGEILIMDSSDRDVGLDPFLEILPGDYVWLDFEILGFEDVIHDLKLSSETQVKEYSNYYASGRYLQRPYIVSVITLYVSVPDGKTSRLVVDGVVDIHP